MATFTEAQVSDLCEILGTNSDVLSDHLTFHASIITESDKTKVLAKVTEWQTLDTDDDGAKITPTNENFGTNYNPETRKNNLRSRIAAILHCEHLGGIGNGQFRVVRG